ncbi:hypothetical protein [Microbispora bryophytorum]|uniref:hypothetical protein n=1 Tax=Microbispora bryophytorum TaxID=1460882 RepID=UPI0033C2A63A
MLVLGAADPGGAVWASLVTGDTGFAGPAGDRDLVVAALPVALQLTGRARVDWDPRRSAELPGALRIVEFDVERAVEIRHATTLRWGPGAFVPLRPGARRRLPRR